MNITVELEDLSGVKKRIKVQVPAETAAGELNRIANDYRKHARLPGFRPGKAPVELVKRRFQKDIRQEVLQKLVPESYQQALKEKGLRPLGQPSLENLDFQEGKPLVYEARFEIGPRISLPPYRGLEVSADERVVTEDDVDQQISTLRQQHARLVSVEGRPAEFGDYAVVDLSGNDLEQEGHEHHHQEPIQDENAVFQIGDEQNLQAFNDSLTGLRVGEEKDVEVDYPADYPNQRLAGHRIRFHLRLNDIKKRELPEVNDDFAKDLGEFQTLAELRDKIREELAEQNGKNRESDLKKKLVDKLTAATEFEVPEALLEERIDHKIRDLAYTIAAQGVDPSKANVDWAKARNQMRPQAEQEVRAAVILEEIANQEKLEVSSEELESELDQVAHSMNQPKEKVRQYFEKENRMEGLAKQTLRRKALEVVYHSAEIVTGR